MNSSQSPQKQSLPSSNPYLTPSYLLNLSSHIQKLSEFYIQQSLPSLSSEYKSFLQSTFSNLSNYLTVFQQDQNMIISSLLSTKVQMEMFLGEKLYQLLQKQTKPLAQIIQFILVNNRENSQHYEELLIRERKRKIHVQNQKYDTVVNNLKKQVIIKRQYLKQLEERIRDLQEENSQIYHKIIDNAKSTISNTLIQTKVLTGNLEFMTPGKLSKVSPPSHVNQNSPPAHKISHKQLSLKQVEQTIVELITLKKKQQLINQKRTSFKSYLKHYFKYKFGLSQLCEQMQCNFLAALKYFLSNHFQQTESSQRLQSQTQKPLLLLFSKLLQEQIDQQFFWKDYQSKGQKAIRVFKRYLNQKQKIDLKYLDRLYDGTAGISGPIPSSTNKIMINQNDKKDIILNQTDVRFILLNIYKSNSQVQTLQMIFNQIINKTGIYSDPDQYMTEQNAIYIPNINTNSNKSTSIASKQLLGIIICYQIQSYSLKLNPLTNIIKKNSLTSEFVFLNYGSLQKIILDLEIQEQKYLPFLQKNYQELKLKQFTYSQMIEIICGDIIKSNTYTKNNNGFNSSRKL